MSFTYGLHINSRVYDLVEIPSLNWILIFCPIGFRGVFPIHGEGKSYWSAIMSDLYTSDSAELSKQRLIEKGFFITNLGFSTFEPTLV